MGEWKDLWIFLSVRIRIPYPCRQVRGDVVIPSRRRLFVELCHAAFVQSFYLFAGWLRLPSPISMLERSRAATGVTLSCASVLRIARCFLLESMIAQVLCIKPGQIVGGRT